jgi:hypothetical protein
VPPLRADRLVVVGRSYEFCYFVIHAVAWTLRGAAPFTPRELLQPPA